MHKNIILLIILLLLIYVFLTYMKSVVLYKPSPAIEDKYHRFYQKVTNLMETENHVVNKFINTNDNILLDTLYLKNDDSDKCIIFFHGNAGNLSMRFDMLKFLYNYASVVIFDYRSYGRSSGISSNLSSHGLHIDAISIWKYVNNDLGFHANNISLFGESLGCSVAIYLASVMSRSLDNQNYPHSLILNSPFYSLRSMVEIMFNNVNISFFGKIISLFFGNKYQSNEWIKYINYQTKIIIAHSPRDEIVPYSEGENLFNQISGSHPNTKFINITGTHNNLGLTDNYIYALADLFND